MRLGSVIAFLFILFAWQGAKCAGIDNVSVWSEAMGKDVDVTVITPETSDEYCVIYLLHGYGGDNRTWLDKTKPDLPLLADSLGVAFVCPDGGNYWYFDSPVDEAACYETFVTSELVSFIDSTYHTVDECRGRGICGYSMGGHGALWCAIRHQDVYCAAASISGCVDLTGYPANWEIYKVLGQYESDPQLWYGMSVTNHVDEIGELRVAIDCGTDDIFHADNCRLHDKLDSLGISHLYESHPGAHTHDYWGEAIDRMMPFFIDSFRNSPIGGE